MSDDPRLLHVRAALEELRAMRAGMAGSREGEFVEQDGVKYVVLQVARRWPTKLEALAWEMGPGDYIERRLLQAMS